jgi:hypothetical protein
MKLKLSLIAAGVLAATSMVATTAQAAPTFADVITIVDESGSMSTEHAWLGGMVGSLDAGLNTAGLTPNQYGLVGFGGSTSHLPGHQHDVGGAGSQFGTSGQYATATGTLLTNGGTEDGYSGIDVAKWLHLSRRRRPQLHLGDGRRPRHPQRFYAHLRQYPGQPQGSQYIVECGGECHFQVRRQYRRAWYCVEWSRL